MDDTEAKFNLNSPYAAFLLEILLRRYKIMVTGIWKRQLFLFVYESFLNSCTKGPNNTCRFMIACIHQGCKPNCTRFSGLELNRKRLTGVKIQEQIPKKWVAMNDFMSIISQTELSNSPKLQAPK
eukprot:m.148124 g.148124  ORF g.148124 m.148124 type:complete len:125 (-) comp14995_c0_seq17:1037-1411(-)